MIRKPFYFVLMMFCMFFALADAFTGSTLAYIKAVFSALCFLAWQVDVRGANKDE